MDDGRFGKDVLMGKEELAFDVSDGKDESRDISHERVFEAGREGEEVEEVGKKRVKVDVCYEDA